MYRAAVWCSLEQSLIVNTNLARILHRFRDIALDRSKTAIIGYPCCV